MSRISKSAVLVAIIALFALSGVVAKLTKEYFADKTKLKQ